MKMFENAGSKIKTLAIILFALIVLMSVIMSFCFRGFGIGMIAFLIFIPLGILIGWMSAIGLYAFGELCENVHAINEKLGKKESMGTIFTDEFSAPQKMVNCPKCGKPTSADSRYCIHCGDVIQ